MPCPRRRVSGPRWGPRPVTRPACSRRRRAPRPGFRCTGRGDALAANVDARSGYQLLDHLVRLVAERTRGDDVVGNLRNHAALLSSEAKMPECGGVALPSLGDSFADPPLEVLALGHPVSAGPSGSSPSDARTAGDQTTFRGLDPLCLVMLAMLGMANRGWARNSPTDRRFAPPRHSRKRDLRGHDAKILGQALLVGRSQTRGPHR
jgi:hypothetical protein